MANNEDDLIQLFTMVAMGLTKQVVDFNYQGMKIGRLIFIINYIGYKKECSMKDVIDYLNIKPSTATRQVDKLVDKLKLVERKESISDRRLVILQLTKLGNDIYLYHKKISEIPASAINERFSNEEKQILKKGLEELLKAFS